MRVLWMCVRCLCKPGHQKYENGICPGNFFLGDGHGGIKAMTRELFIAGFPTFLSLSVEIRSLSSYQWC